MDRAKLDNWCEQGILALVLAILVFGPLATGAVRTLEFLVIQGLTMGAMTLWAIRFWLRTNDRLLWPPVCWLVLAFVGYAFFRYQQADLEYVARGELLRIVIYAFLFFIILDSLNRQEAIQLVVFVLVFLAMAISFYALYQFFTKSDQVWHFIRPEGYRGRGSGTFICPNNLAGFLEMVLPLGLAYTLTSRVKHASKVLLGYASMAIVVGIGVTLSRAGWVATALSLLAFFAVLIRNRGYRLPALAFLLVLLAGAFLFFKHSEQPQQRLQKAFRRDDWHITDVRPELWKSALQMWKDHFWLGVGPAHYDYRFPAYRPATVQQRPDRVHNDYINTLADWGLVGAALVASALSLVFWSVIRSWKFVRRSNDFATKSSNRSSFVLGAAVGLLAIAVHALADFNMHIPANAILAVALMALVTGHWRFATERYWVTRSWAVRSAFTILILCGLVFLGKQGAVTAGEYRFLEQAGKAKRFEQALFRKLKQLEAADELDWEEHDKTSKEIRPTQLRELAFLKQAYAAEPNNFATTYKIGEALRNPAQGRFEESLRWYSVGMKLNPWDAYNFLRYGLSLHELNRSSEAEPYFKRAVELDPNSFYVTAHYGWHFYMVKNYAEAKGWMERSVALSMWRPNIIAWSYLKYIEAALQKKTPN